ncbi:MAG: branched-chain amino acid ABC transporter permease [Verrucomicrobiota bacterium]
MIAKSKIVLLVALIASCVISRFSKSINPYHLDIIIAIGINITLAVSLNLINGYTGQFSLGHAGFMAVGGYTAAVVTTTFGAKLLPLLGGTENIFAKEVLFLIALFTGGIFAAIAGVLVGAPSLRLKGDYLAIVTLGFGEIIRVLLQNTETVGASRGLTGIPSYTNLFWTFGVAAITVYIVVSLVQSTYGRGFVAVRDDEVAAEAIGINTTRYKIIAFVIGAFFAGIAGGLYGHFKQYLNPEGFGFMRSIEIVVMVILGGMGNTLGVIIAAILLTVLPEVLRPVAEYRMIIYSLLLIMLMLTRPQGLFTWRKKSKPALSA